MSIVHTEKHIFISQARNLLFFRPEYIREQMVSRLVGFKSSFLKEKFVSARLT